MVSTIVRFDLLKTSAFSEGQIKLDKSKNKLNPNSKTNNDIQLFLVSFEN